MRKLKEIASNYGISRPIFRIKLSPNGKSLEINTGDPVIKYNPPSGDDTLENLVASHYREFFYINEQSFKISNNIAEEALSEIRGSIKKFVERNLKMKNPRQSKIYRWIYRSMPRNDDFNDGLVLLYKYIKSFTDESIKANYDAQHHLDNAMAILGAMEEKYSEQ